MRKRGKQIKHRAKSKPGLVVNQQDYEIQLRASVDAFRLGYAQASHYLDLRDCVDLITVADAIGFAKKDDSALSAANLACVALMNIRDRQKETGKLGATGDELRALSLLIDASCDYWARRSGALYQYAYGEMQRVRASQMNDRVE